MIQDTVRRFIADELAQDGNRAAITDDYPLLERQVLDSLAMFELVSFLESEFGIEIRDEELVPANFGTIGDIARLVDEKRR
jgi:acyl carrier protein